MSRVLFESIFRGDIGLSYTNVILAGKDLFSPHNQSAYSRCFALISPYEPPLILSALRSKGYYRPDLGTIRIPYLDIMLLLPSRRCFHIPSTMPGRFLHHGTDFVLPAISQSTHFELVGRLNDDRSALTISFAEFIWTFAGPTTDPLKLYQSQLRGAVRTLLPGTLEPEPLRTQIGLPTCYQPQKSVFESSPSVVQKALMYAESIGEGPVLVEAIARLSLTQQANPLEGEVGAWIRGIWTVAVSEAQFANIPVWYQEGSLKRVVTDRDGVRAVIDAPTAVLAAMDQRYVGLRASCRLGRESRALIASQIVITGIVTDDKSFVHVAI